MSQAKFNDFLGCGFGIVLIAAGMLIVALTVGAAFAQTGLQPQHDYTIEQRREMALQDCKDHAPDAWRVGEEKQQEWLRSCESEAPSIPDHPSSPYQPYGGGRARPH